MAETENEKSTTQHIDAEIGHAQHAQHAPAPAIHLHHDTVAPEAIGGLYNEMPAKYYRSPAFIGTLVVSLRLPTKADNQMLTSPHRPLVLLRFLDT